MNRLKKCSLPVLLAGLLLLSGCQAPVDSQNLTAKESYQLEKINEVSDKILAREAIPQDYFRFFPEDSSFQEDLQAYNDLTAALTISGTQKAQFICSRLSTEEDSVSKLLTGYLDAHLSLPQAYHEIEARIAHLSLYENTSELCQADPVLAHIIAPEYGGSYGMWPGELHLEFEGTREDSRYTEYFELIDTLLEDLDILRDIS